MMYLYRLSRKLQARGEGFYTFGSSGPEGNAAIVQALRSDDMAFLHDRSAAFQIHRAGQVPGETPAWDMLLSFTPRSTIRYWAGGAQSARYEAIGDPAADFSRRQPPAQSGGARFSIGIAQRLRLEDGPFAPDGVVLASFGDASANHSTAQWAFNTAPWAAYQGTPMPIVFACEGNLLRIRERNFKIVRSWSAVRLIAHIEQTRNVRSRSRYQKS